MSEPWSRSGRALKAQQIARHGSNNLNPFFDWDRPDAKDWIGTTEKCYVCAKKVDTAYEGGEVGSCDTCKHGELDGVWICFECWCVKQRACGLWDQPVCYGCPRDMCYHCFGGFQECCKHKFCKSCISKGKHSLQTYANCKHTQCNYQADGCPVEGCRCDGWLDCEEGACETCAHFERQKAQAAASQNKRAFTSSSSSSSSSHSSNSVKRQKIADETEWEAAFEESFEEWKAKRDQKFASMTVEERYEHHETEKRYRALQQRRSLAQKDYTKLTNTKLKTNLKKRKLLDDGPKAALVGRLKQNDELVKCKSGDCDRMYMFDLCSICTAAVSKVSWLEGKRTISAAAFVNRCFC